MSATAELRGQAHGRAPKQEFTDLLGMVVALAAWAMMFGALFFLYAGLRSRAAVWPPVGVPRLPVALPGVGTAVLVASSVALDAGVRALRDPDPCRRRALAPCLTAAVALGLVFLGLQITVWMDLWRAGLRPSTGAYGSVFYGLTALHAVHVAAGLVALLVVLVRALRGAYTEHNTARVRVCAMFWHFVDAVWALMFVTLYLL